MRGNNSPQTAGGFQNRLSVGSVCQSNHQAGHEGISGANRVLDDYFWSLSANEGAPIPERRTRRTHGNTNTRRVCCFRDSCAIFGDGICIRRWIGRRFAGSQPRSDLANLVMVELDEIGAGREFDDTLRIGEWRTHIDVEEFQWALEHKKAFQLLAVVRRAGG